MTNDKREYIPRTSASDALNQVVCTYPSFSLVFYSNFKSRESELNSGWSTRTFTEVPAFISSIDALKLIEEV
ncbi:hypothetical protein T4D_4583 [Trichinella pseudospiralis]|uniref:Uncharacterized protein n=1 Tax=Trichinella pseudospiralis TaxID=6337 RepID=A0A0V1G502_TRIPS|nr:hypothetical protein T4D_4583 [Trichinella pseudospiralis]